MSKSYTNLKDIEAALAASGSPYIQGDTPSTLDTEAFTALKGDELNKLTSTAFPHTFAWYAHLSCFTEAMIKGFGKAGAAVKASAVEKKGGDDKGGDKKKEKKEKKEKAEKGGEKKLSAKELRLLKKQEEAAAKDAKDPNDPCAHKFGDRELMRSQGDPEVRFKKQFTKVASCTAALEGKEVIIRARIHNSRAKGKGCFVVLRQQTSTIQAALFVGGEGDSAISKGMVGWSGKLPKESIVEVKAKVAKAEVKTCTQSEVEL